MRVPKVIVYSDMEVILRKDFYEHFDDLFKKIVGDTGASYFGHNIIKNYREPGHKISTFCNYEKWHEIYWDKYRNFDPLERTLHQTVLKSDYGVVSWEIGHNGSPCSQERIKATQVREGITFSFKRPDNYLETLIIGWSDLDLEKLDTDYILHLSSIVLPIRDHHWEVHDKT
jgi:hypothetical protein